MRGFQGSHNKFMVSEKAVLVGTSNWTEDYFTTTAGVTIVMEVVRKNSDSNIIDIRQQFEEIFFRDFNSTIAQDFRTNQQ